MNVLRPKLYQQLQRVFGVVKVANHGMAIRWSLKTETWRDGTRRTVRYMDKNKGDGWGECYRVNCPYCGDKKQRLYISHMWGHVDETTGTRNLWLAFCQNEDCIDSAEMRKSFHDLVFGSIHGVGGVDVVVKGKDLPKLAEGEVEYPGSVWLLDRLAPDHAAVAYLQSRRYNANWLAANLGVGYIWEPPINKQILRDRIFIPVYLGGILVGWQARSVDQPRHNESKYLFSLNFPRSRAIYNYDLARAFPCVTVLEGATKVWRYGRDSVAAFGKRVTDLQLMLLTSTWKQLVFMLDSDARKESLELVSRVGQSAQCWVVLLKPGQAVDDLETKVVRGFSEQARLFPAGSIVEADQLGVS